AGEVERLPVVVLEVPRPTHGVAGGGVEGLFGADRGHAAASRLSSQRPSRTPAMQMAVDATHRATATTAALVTRARGRIMAGRPGRGRLPATARTAAGTPRPAG